MGDYSEILRPSGYCHLGGDPIPDVEVYGAGLVDASVLHTVTATAADTR